MQKPKADIARAPEHQGRLSWFLLLALAATFSVMLYPRPVSTRFNYRVGDVVQKDIKAPRDFFIEDQEATEGKRRQAVETVKTVYDLDSGHLPVLTRQVHSAFSLVRVELETDQRARQLEAAQRHNPVMSDTISDLPARPSLHEQLWQQKGAFEKALGIPVSDGAFAILENEHFAPFIEEMLVQILGEILDNGVVNNKEILLREADQGIVLRDIATRKERIIYDLKQFYGHDQAKTMVRIVGDPRLRETDYNLRNLVVDLAQRLIQPNITLNRSETAERRRTAIEAVKPVLYQIKSGEMILREGERVTPMHLLKLKASQPKTDQEQILFNSIGAGALMLCLLAVLNVVGLRRSPPFVRVPGRNMLFLVTVLALFFTLARVTLSLATALAQQSSFGITPPSIFFGMPMAGAAMLVCLFFGLDLALAAALVVGVTLPLLLPHHDYLLFYFLLNGAMGAYWMRNCRERKTFVTAGVRLALFNLLLASVINLYAGNIAYPRLIWDWTFALLGGIGAGIVTAGLAPLVEMAFGYTTDISLLELANLDRPILRRLMMEAPGTYHHSVIVGSLVEAAAAEIGANPLLAKVCGYYHDIGKINKPLYFIENQSDGKNRHDKLAPSMSKRILVAHVKDGVEMGRQHKLGQPIIDTICQSHGTSLIVYFFEKAKQLQGEANVNPDDYRYPGPRPQTREAGLVMLADVVEAASRTLENPTPSRIRGLVQNLINKIFSDGQLDDCELTLKDLHSIAKSFNKILNGIHHHRIEYPERSGTNGKGRNDRSDRQPPEPLADRDRKPAPSSPGHLKRLGMS